VEAIAAFREPIDSGAGYLASVKSEDERSGVRKVIEGAYRGLVAAQLAVAGNEETALRTWQTYRNLDAPLGFNSARSSDEGVLWFLESTDGFVAWFSRGDEISFHRFGATKAKVSAVAARFLRACSDPNRSPETLQSDALTLHQWMVEPFSHRIRGAVRSLIFELDGALAGLPVQALVSRDGHYLGERFAVLVSAGRSGAAHRHFPAGGASVLAVVNPEITGASAARFPPLPDSLREAEAIRASFARSVVLEGRDASVDSLAREIPKADIIHFAGHGYSDSGYGGLLFAPKDVSSADYELLRASQIREMDWSRSSLVVLSACAAAEGETHGAHNPESLIGAITKAGVPRVAASLWNVDSAASAQLMAEFYAGLKNGRGDAEALRAAQSAIRRNPRWQHPYYWAGFQLYGTT
jgi:CHAT domain-containing protein